MTNQFSPPRLFDYATSELSQDATLIWLLSWADPKYKDTNKYLHECAKELIRLFTNKDANFKITSITPWKQWESIDVWIEINDCIELIIEDKTSCSEHNDQLERYKKIAEKWCKENNSTKKELHFAYVKTRSFNNIERDWVENTRKWKVFDRKDLLDVLTKYSSKITNDIFKDFYSYLYDLEQDELLFQKIPVTDWNGTQRIGFFKSIENSEMLKGSSWHYVNNRAGGFWCLWLPGFSSKQDNYYYYFQFVNQKLVIKISVEDCKENKNRSELRSLAISELESALSSDSILYESLKKPARYGNGMHMTIKEIDEKAWLETDDKNHIKLKETLNKLKNLQNELGRILS